MTTLEQAARQALEALIWTTGSTDFGRGGQANEGAIKLLFPAITALRQALEQQQKQEPTVKDYLTVEQSKQEPVAWIRRSGLDMLKRVNVGCATVYASEDMSNHSTARYSEPPKRECSTALYTEPPKREWVGLKADEIHDVVLNLPIASSYLRIARAIEAKLKELNK